MKQINLNKYLFTTIAGFFCFISFSFACEAQIDLEQKINKHQEAVEKYTESQNSINQSLNKITKNTNGFLVKKLISYKQDNFNDLVTQLISTENQYISLASSTAIFLCKDLDKKQQTELKDLENKILALDNQISEQKSEIEDYIKKDLRKILTDLKTISNTKEQKETKEILKK